MKDARGKTSKTLIMVAASLSVLLLKFVAGGLDVGLGEIPVITASEFGLAATGIIGAWVAREWKDKDVK